MQVMATICFVHTSGTVDLDSGFWKANAQRRREEVAMLSCDLGTQVVLDSTILPMIQDGKHCQMSRHSILFHMQDRKVGGVSSPTSHLRRKRNLYSIPPPTAPGKNPRSKSCPVAQSLALMIITPPYLARCAGQGARSCWPDLNRQCDIRAKRIPPSVILGDNIYSVDCAEGCRTCQARASIRQGPCAVRIQRGKQTNFQNGMAAEGGNERPAVLQQMHAFGQQAVKLGVCRPLRRL